ncbi:MAG: dipeptidase PepE [Candidatus Thermoplasmatota archaeon]|nr:dipeptidase PepE [Candidatus Thermoplasmatota archaeon]
MSEKILLISNSTLYGGGYLDHCKKNIQNILDDRTRVAFVPYARPSGISHDKYTKIAQKAYKDMGYQLFGVHEHKDPSKAIKEADAIFIGGGNTFVLLTMLYKNDLLNTIRSAVQKGTPYIGTSAGSNVAGATIQTTNDMPIMYPPSFNALHLVPFVLNPHYIDPDPTSKHMGETRETRIKEYHVFNDRTVVGLREGCMLEIKGNSVTLKGVTNARVFQKQKEPMEYRPNDRMDDLLSNKS